MKLTQISVFLENRPGRLSALAHSLATAGVNLSTLMLSDNGEFGLLRLLIEIREQPVGIQRVEKEASVALVPERSDNLVGKELRPLGRRLVDHFRVPVGVFR